MLSHLYPTTLPPHPALWSPGTAPAASLGLCSCSSPSPQHTPSSCAVVYHGPDPFHFHILFLLRKTMQPRENMPIAEAPQLLVGPDEAPSSDTGLHHHTHLHLDPPAVHLHSPRLTPITSIHYRVSMVRLSSHIMYINKCPFNYHCTYSWPQSRLLALTDTTTCKFTTSLCHYTRP